ncbi:hypothetical protein J5N97_017356 [Dioscorea zingiberensis]|uniref:Uncharacterized protein n=1 Tax=Dioscorea zingiberensis TaxID=325984 RepID=A0A9D5HG23_9LILI|nr:hypothetical protein J5N97_017356 [Dioscorea zingiberensis]
MTPRSIHIVLIILFLISLTICASLASHSITINDSLSGDQKLTSRGGNFVLGFFTIDNSSGRYYIGIWYNKVSELTPVWVANRVTPVSDPTKSLLHISHDGNLVLQDQLAKSSPIWSTNATISSSHSTIAVLQDNGNLVLSDGENSSNVFWQSFENPTHTWLPGAKIAFNKRTGVSQRLTSWKNSGNPAPGLFSYEMGQNGEFLIRWNMSKTYWTTGPWDGRSFSQIPQMTAHHMSDYTFVNSSEEIYFFYTIRDNATISSRVVMDVSGQMKMLMWAEEVRAWTQISLAPEAQCQVTALCGPFGSCNEQRLQRKCTCVMGFSERSPKDWDLSDFSGGCTRNTPLQCGGNTSSAYVEQDKFLPISSVRLPADAQQFQAGINVDECEQACLNNCSCTAYSYGNTTCSLWYGGLLNLQDEYDGADGAGTLYLRLCH